MVTEDVGPDADKNSLPEQAREAMRRLLKRGRSLRNTHYVLHEEDDRGINDEPDGGPNTERANEHGERA